MLIQISRLFLINLTLFTMGCGFYTDKEQRRTYAVYYEADAEATTDPNNPNDPANGQGQNNNSGNNGDGTNDDETNTDVVVDPSLKLRGGIQDVTAVGEVYGWAVFPDDASVILDVDVYINGDATDGTFLGTFTANQEGFDNGFEGNHGFRAQIPDEFRDGQTHTLTAFAEIDGNVEPVYSQTFSFRSFLPTAEGQQYYNDVVRPLLQANCGGCHTNRAPQVNYNAQYDYMLSPNPAKTGTNQNNTLINKASGGMNHGGNNRCGGNGKNGSPCLEMQTWWEMEFGAE